MLTNLVVPLHPECLATNQVVSLEMFLKEHKEKQREIELLNHAWFDSLQ